jgi:hypothetical protein
MPKQCSVFIEFLYTLAMLNIYPYEMCHHRTCRACPARNLDPRYYK